jgi:FAD binding domain/Berberine and berberine like
MGYYCLNRRTLFISMQRWQQYIEHWFSTETIGIQKIDKKGFYMTQQIGKQLSSQDIAIQFGGEAAYQEALKTLASHLQGQLLLPGDYEYREYSYVFSGPGTPAMVARCANATDVSTAVNFAREHHLSLSIRSAGHHPGGFATNNGGMVIELRNMRDFSFNEETGIARIEPGMLWGEVAEALEPYGLSLTSGDHGTVGVGGLTQGGGVGWMVRKYGLTIDNLHAVEVVTADGCIQRASLDENPDLFWGIRGGAGNFGVVTAFDFKPHPAGNVIYGTIYYDGREGVKVLRGWTDYGLQAPEELTVTAILMPPSRQQPSILSVIVCYTGDRDKGIEAITPLAQLGTVLGHQLQEMPYSALVPASAPASYQGTAFSTRTMFMDTFSDEAIETLIREYTKPGAPPIQLRVLGGAMGRVPADAMAFAHRNAQIMLMSWNGGPAGAAAAERVRRSLDTPWQTLKPFASGTYVNFQEDEGEESLHAAYPPATYARLVEIKNRYDPTNLFSNNHNIKPTVQIPDA